MRAPPQLPSPGRPNRMPPLSHGQPRDIIVLGASAGGLDALKRIVHGLPRDLPAALFVVLHIGANRRSELAAILSAAGPLPAIWAEDGAPIEPGRIHVAPPDHHLLIEPGRLRLSRGPRENRTRPAADPLFRSAALAYGPRVAGVVLSGTLGDGTAGLAEIKRRGGVSVVQDPRDAAFPGMPLSALRHTRVDYRATAAEMAGLLARLACGQPPPARLRREAEGPRPATQPAPVQEETMTGGYELKPPAALTCPLCGGAVAQTSEDSLPYFTCHIGHRFAAADMDEAQFRELEKALEVALRVLNERRALCYRMAMAARGRAAVHTAGLWDSAAREAEERAEVLRRFVEKGWLRPDPDEPAEAPGGAIG